MRSMRSVWAPHARTVAVVVHGVRFSLMAGPEGRFLIPDEAAARLVPGARYGFSLDGGPPLPDPRSKDQPDGVFGLSRVLDDAWPWTDAGFVATPLEEALVYELHVGTFSPEGTFAGAQARLDHLKSLGVTHVELMPVASFDGRWGWGYDGVALFAPHAGYGGPHGLKSFINACHARGLAVVLDVVMNHIGPSGSVLAAYGPYLSHAHPTPWGAGINFDGAHSDEVRRFFIDNARMWVEEYHADALRLDAVHTLPASTALPFIEELVRDLNTLEEKIGRRIALIAECDRNDPRLVTQRADGGVGLTAQWNDDFHHALHVALTGEQHGYYADFAGLPHVAVSLERGFVYEGQHSVCRQRRHGRPWDATKGGRLVGYAQSHDHVGNRGHGERLPTLVGLERAKIALALVFFSPFIPMLFQGEEWGATTPFLYFADHSDARLADAVRAGRRAACAWTCDDDVPDPEDARTFLASKLDWDQLNGPHHQEVLDFVRSLMALRRSVLELRHGDVRRVRCVVDARAQWLRVDRGAYSLVVNLGETQQVPLCGPSILVLASRSGVQVQPDAVHLPADSASILTRRPCADGAAERREGSPSRG